MKSCSFHDRVRPLACALILWLGSWHRADAGNGPNSPVPIASVLQFYSVPIEEFAQGLPVRLEGVVLYEDPDWRLFYLQDETGATFLEPSGDLNGCRAGDRVRVTGTTSLSGNYRRIAQMYVEVLGPGRLPDPVQLPKHQLTNNVNDLKRISIRGVARAVESWAGQRGMILLDTGVGRLRVYLRQAPPETLTPLLYDTIRVIGLRVPSSQKGEGLLPLEVLVKGLEDVQLELAMPEDPFEAPISTVAGLQAALNQKQVLSLHRVRGRAYDQVVGQSFVLSDGTGRILVQSTLPLVLTNGSRVEAAGFPVLHGTNEVRLEEAVFRLREPSLPTNGAPTNRLFRSIAEIRALTPEQASARAPVLLEAVVTYHDPNWGVLFVQQEDSGIYVQCAEPPAPLRPGDRVRVQGVTGPGGYAPLIKQARVTLLGHGEPLRPAPARELSLFSGLLDATWCELQAQIRAARRVGPNLELELHTPRSGIQAWIPGWGDRPVPEAWIGLEVRARGVVGSRFNALRQLTGVTLHIPGETFLEFQEPVPRAPWDRPVTPIRELLTAPGSRSAPAMAKIRAVVTFAQTNGWIAAEDGTGGLWLQVPEPVPGPGEQVEILGFPTAGIGSVTMEQAKARVIGKGPLPDPLKATATALLSPELEARRVMVQGTLVENQATLDRPYLLLDDAGQLIHVYLPERAAKSLAAWKPGSQVAAIGVCRRQTDEWGRPRSVRIMTAATADLRLVSEPPWLTRRHLAWIGAVAATAAALALACNLTLRRKVRAQTQQLEEQFRARLELKQRYEDLFENAGDAVLMLDPDGRLTAVNRAAEKAFDQPRETLHNTSFAELIHPEDRPRWEQALRTLRENRPCPPFEVRLGPRNGRERILKLHPQPLHQKGELVGFECIGRDLSERRQLEQQLRQMQRLESVGQLAAGVAHDYNNILTVILGHTGLLLSEENLPAAVRDSVQEIQQAATRAANLTRQLLAFSRKQIMQARPTNLNEVVHDMVKMLRRLLGEHIELVLQLDPALAPIHADPGMLEQVIVNLAVNARDAMPNGGTLIVRTETTEITDTHLQRWADAVPGRHVCLTVTDTGIGMDPETLQHIFEPFFTTKPFGKGSGLGLATVYGIVKQHNGWIEVESQPGKGSTFRIYFPALQTAPRKSATRTDQPQSVPRGKETILAVEDEAPLRVMLTSGLRRLGYQVFAAANGHEALQLWKQHRNQINLVITDMVMPGGISGTQLVAELRKDRPDLKVLFSSGYSEEVVGSEINQLPGAFLPKPFTPTRLATAVRACLDGQTPSTHTATKTAENTTA
jgi:PAS domain S-box-containing protein